jgi:subtilisin family serine protease
MNTRSPAPRTILRAEPLEDRSTPAASFADLTPTPAFAPDRVLVSVADGAAAPAKPPFAEAVTPLGLGVYRVDLLPFASVADAVGFYTAQPDVASAEPDRVLALNATPNDPAIPSQYGLSITNTPAAWTRSTGTGSTVVAVIDTGVDYTHPDLAANMWRNPREVPGNGVDDDGNGFADDVYGYDFVNNDADPMDDDRHGTHVAGILGMVGGNGVGGSGVNPAAKVMALKFIAGGGTGYTSDAVRALSYAIANGAKVANASWGGATFDSTLASAIGRARTAGMVFVASAGNDGGNNDLVPFYPANYGATADNVVAVAATDSADRFASYSNQGAKTVTLAAPGTGVYSTLPNNRYGTLSGTSMAAPFVSGAIALLWDANPALTYQQVIAKLKASVDPLASLAGKTVTGGRLNVARMLDAAVPPVVPPPVSPPPATTRETDGARVTAHAFAGTAPQSFDRVRVTFNEKINAGSFTPADVRLVGPAGPFAAVSVTAVANTNSTQFDIAFAPQSAVGAYTATVGVDVYDIAANRMNQNGNAVNGEPTDRFVGTATLAAPAPAVALPAAIPDGGTLEVPLAVTRDGAVADVNLYVFIEHQNVGDLVVQLRSPSGKTVTLVERRGGAGSGFRGTTFDDEARTLISKAASPFVGSYRPEEALSGFDGLPARGTWTLIVSDRSGGKLGRVTAASIDVTTTPAAAVRPEAQQLLGIDVASLLGWVRETEAKK